MTYSTELVKIDQLCKHLTLLYDDAFTSTPELMVKTIKSEFNIDVSIDDMYEYFSLMYEESDKLKLLNMLNYERRFELVEEW